MLFLFCFLFIDKHHKLDTYYAIDCYIFYTLYNCICFKTCIAVYVVRHVPIHCDLQRNSNDLKLGNTGKTV